jgi:hypothetical protein
MLTLYFFVFNIFTGKLSLPFLLTLIVPARTVSLIRGGKGNNRFYFAKTFCPFFCRFFQLQFPGLLFPSKSTGSFVLSPAPAPLSAISSMNPAPVIAAAKVIGFFNPPKLFELFFNYFF